MIGLHSFQVGKKEILNDLENYEAFFLGKKFLTPNEIQNLNEELSIGAIMHVGKYRLQRLEEQIHLFWQPPGKEEHHLGALDNLNVMRDCPGFHRTRSLALGQEHVESSGQVLVPDLKTYISIVKMKDGSTGYGPNYKVALRNAALKMHLKNAFNRASAPLRMWQALFGTA